MAPKPTRSLPPGLLIQTGQWVWRTLWQVMMAQMAPRDRTGAYQRPPSQFRGDLGDSRNPDPNHPHPAEPDRYRLIVGTGCPWAHRTLVVRALKGLEAAIPLTLVVPKPEAGGWVFVEPFQGCSSLAQAYQLAQPGYTGRCTVPVLWDDRRQTIVNNESAEIIVWLNDRCNAFAQNPDLDLYPADLRQTIDLWNEKIYHRVNNGVYRCGFAQTQAAYDQACNELFEQLDELESLLAGPQLSATSSDGRSGQDLTQAPGSDLDSSPDSSPDFDLDRPRYICGDRLTLADVRLFTTLFRFDAVYHPLFKCSRRRIQDYPALSRHLRSIYHLPGVAATCDLNQVKQDYFGNLFPLNPSGIIPQSAPDPIAQTTPGLIETAKS
ncbi:MAG: glutathione S-transferase family protein [Prochlorothrix sp.]